MIDWMPCFHVRDICVYGDACVYTHAYILRTYRYHLYTIDKPNDDAAGLEPVDLLLLMACSENDTPKVEEVLKAGADINVKDLNGKSPMELCTKEEVKELLQKAGA